MIGMINKPEKPTAIRSDVFTSLPQEVQAYIQLLEKQVVVLMHQVEKLVAKVGELEARLTKDSSNSHKPPSSDGLGKKPKTSSLRGKSDRNPGGQPGHTGRTLEQVLNPNYIEVHRLMTCEQCQSNLSKVEPSGFEKRQVFDLPKLVVEVTEHQAEIKQCPCCNHRAKGKFPENVKASTQYGERILSLAAYFEHQHLIPMKRIAQIFEDLYGLSLSAGTCQNTDKKLYKNLETFESNLKPHLLACKVLNFDETGMRCEKKLHWIHVTSSACATFYGMHHKRGQQALNDFAILPNFTGSAIHDHWSPYFTYQQVQHALCNAHHLRELKYVFEQEKGAWAQKMASLLLKANKMAKQTRDEGKGKMALQDIQIIQQEYAKIILEGLRDYQGVLMADEQEIKLQPFKEKVGKAGCNLLRRLLHKMDNVLAFVHNLQVPFTNNQAEQDLRMLKLDEILFYS